MKIDWGRVLNAGLVAEILLLLAYQFVVQLYGCGVFRNIEMKYLASTMLNDEETIQNPEGESGHGEEIHGCDDFAMIAQERSPGLAFLV